MFLKSFSVMVLFSFFAGFSAQAANYGKFKLVPESSLYDSDPVVFLLNSSGNVKILEDGFYYSINNDSSSEESKLKFKSSGDEEALHAIYNLSDNKITSGCAASVDIKNGHALTLTIKKFRLLRWNKSSEEYESMITAETVADSDACYEELFRGLDVTVF